jgi:hypothetical protein
VKYLNEAKELLGMNWSQLGKALGMGRTTMLYWSQEQRVPYAPVQKFVQGEITRLTESLGLAAGKTAKDLAAFQKRWGA